MQLAIKNMVCDRCILVVRQQLESMNFSVDRIALGTVDIHPEPTEAQKNEIATSLHLLGFELIDKEKDRMVEQIKTIVIEAIHHSDSPELAVNFPELLSERLHREYSWLSRLFSSGEGITLERFIIQQKIEKVKELLQYEELTISEIAWKMGYSSSAHLSNQFKSVTGETPKAFRAGFGERKSLDKV